MELDFDAAIFDMDGTLLDTMPYWRFTALEYALNHQWPVYEDLVARMYPTSARKLLYEYAERVGAKIEYWEMVRELESYMNRHYLYDAHLKDPSLPAFLDALKARGVRMCVATGAPRAYACNGLKRLGILEYFDFVTDNYEMPIMKSDPSFFVNVLERLGAGPERCWVFEDALYAMKTAKACGIHVCAIEDEAQRADREAIREISDVYIKSYAELM
ncbi:MAG: HAD family phosphatase [Clostridia bacterium]|nr:HAD family phosphatase [Clostridia bacterium]